MSIINQMNINPAFQRLNLLVGAQALTALSRAKVVVFGLGGVGSWCAEALVRSGIGNISLVDFDRVETSNINRQIEATTKTIGQMKTDALAARLKEISPDCIVTPIAQFFSCGDEMEKAAQRFNIPQADYIIDAIDSLESKLDLIETAAQFNVTLFSSMGMALKMDPTRLQTADIWKTKGCPLARNVREGLRKRNFKGNFIVVYSEEKAMKNEKIEMRNEKLGMRNERELSSLVDSNPGIPCKKPLGSIVTVTATAGMILANLVIQDICRKSYE